MELYRKYRPQLLEEVAGQEAAVRLVSSFLEKGQFPHASLFVGPTGVGKTTMARLVADAMGCRGFNLVEINCANDRGLDLVRMLEERVECRPMTGGASAFILDEAVQIPPMTQKAFLKLLEDPPDFAYFLLCTTDTAGLLPTFRSRCQTFKLEVLERGALHEVIHRALKGEGVRMEPAVVDAICAAAGGSARWALQLLEAALTAAPAEAQMRLVGGMVPEEKAVEFLARALLSRADNWKSIADTLKSIEAKDVEGVRRKVLDYAAKVLLENPGNQVAHNVIVCFEKPFFDSGWPGLVGACWDVWKGRQGK